VFDALTSKRPYKSAFSTERSLEIMSSGRGTHFDPDLYDLFLANMDRVLEIKNSFPEE